MGLRCEAPRMHKSSMYFVILRTSKFPFFAKLLQFLLSGRLGVVYVKFILNQIS